MLAGEKHPYLRVLRLLLQLCDLPLQFPQNVFPLGGEFGERPQILGLPGEP
jgi:hypothetical protein